MVLLYIVFQFNLFGGLCMHFRQILILYLAERPPVTAHCGAGVRTTRSHSSGRALRQPHSHGGGPPREAMQRVDNPQTTRGRSGI